MQKSTSTFVKRTSAICLTALLAGTVLSSCIGPLPPAQTSYVYEQEKKQLAAQKAERDRLEKERQLREFQEYKRRNTGYGVRPY